MIVLLASLLALLGLALTMGQSNASTSHRSQTPEEWDKILDECHVPGAFPQESEPRAGPFQQGQQEVPAEHDGQAIDEKREKYDC